MQSRIISTFKRISWLKVAYAVAVMWGGSSLIAENISNHWVQMFCPVLFIGILVLVALPTVLEEWWVNHKGSDTK